MVRIVFIIILFLMTGCASSPPAQAAAITPRATQTASAVPSPTLDYRATMQVQVDAAAQAADVSRRAELDAQQRAIYAEQTAVAAQVQVYNAKITLGAQELERIHANATNSSIAATRSANEYSYWAARQTATAQAPALIMAVAQAQSNAKIAEWDSTIRAWTGLVWGLFGLVGAIVILVVLWQRQPAIVEDDEPEANPVSLPVTLIQRDNGVLDRITPPPCTELQWGAWCTTILAGGSGSIGFWEHKDSPFKGAEYRLGLHDWAVKNKLIAVVDKYQVLTDTGRDYCNRHTPASSEDTE